MTHEHTGLVQVSWISVHRASRAGWSGWVLHLDGACWIRQADRPEVQRLAGMRGQAVPPLLGERVIRPAGIMR